MTVTNEALLNSLLADVVKLRNEYGYAYNKLETALCHYDEVNVKMTIRLTREKLDEIIKRHMQQQETPDNERYEHEKN